MTRPGALLPRLCLTLVIILCGPALAHSTGEQPAAATVMAEIATRDEARIEGLSGQFEVLGYRWRDGTLVIAGAPDDLPSDAVLLPEEDLRLPHPTPKGATSLAGYPCYRTVEATEARLSGLAEQHPQLARWVPYGESWERTALLGGSELRALVISNQVIPGPKPVLMIMSTMHPRELATAESATRFAEWLLDGYGVAGDPTWMVDYLEIHILAQHNPDGRQRVEAGASLWRKNTNTAYCSAQPLNVGVDLNRNASTVFWGGFGASGNTCQENYAGPFAGSEPETAALEAWVAQSFPDQRDGALSVGAPDDASGVFISLHSFGEFVFYPWEGDDIDTGNEAGYRALTQRMAELADYASCQNCCLGRVGGTSVDQVYEAVGAASLTLEIGTTFFQSCESFESDVWPEAFALFRYAARAARRPYLSSFGPSIASITAERRADGGVDLTASADDGGYRVNHSCTRRDPDLIGSTVARILVSVNEPPWLAATLVELDPQDGAWDELSEAATTVLEPSLVPAGSSALLFLVAEDDAGNRGPPYAFRLPADPIFSDSFEADLPIP